MLRQSSDSQRVIFICPTRNCWILATPLLTGQQSELAFQGYGIIRIPHSKSTWQGAIYLIQIHEGRIYWLSFIFLIPYVKKETRIFSNFKGILRPQKWQNLRSFLGLRPWNLNVHSLCHCKCGSFWKIPHHSKILKKCPWYMITVSEVFSTSSFFVRWPGFWFLCTLDM